METLSVQQISQSNDALPEVQELVAIARVVFCAKLPSLIDGADHFDSYVWDVRSLRTEQSKRTNPRLLFTRRCTEHDPLPAEFADVVKSWIILANVVSGVMAYRLDAARFLWEAILVRRNGHAQNLNWSTLSISDFEEAENMMRATLALSTAYKLANQLVLLDRFLSDRNLCRPLGYKAAIPRTESMDRYTLAGQEARQAKLPTSQALDALADLYASEATEPADRLRLAIIAILIVTGFRITEVLTLPLDCEYEDTSSEKTMESQSGNSNRTGYGLRYYPEKTRAKNPLAIRWLTPVGAELARQAIAEIKTLTKEARERARILEANPNIVPLPNYRWNEIIRTKELADMMGVVYQRVLALSREGVPQYKDDKGIYFQVADVQNYLMTRRLPHLWSLRLPNGQNQPLSETLCIVFRNFFHSKKGTIPLLVEPVTQLSIRDFITGRTGISTVFERFDKREEDGTYCSITPHQLRHWLNDIAAKGGLPLELQTRWFGRKNPQDTMAYQHWSQDQRIEWLKGKIRDGAAVGQAAEVYQALPEDEREIFLEGQVQAVHVTPMGFCIHSFAVEPCQYHLNCLAGCPDYLRTKGNKQEVIYLQQVKQLTQRALSDAESEAAAGKKHTHDWAAAHKTVLQGVERALSVEADAAVQDGQQVAPFLDNSSGT